MSMNKSRGLHHITAQALVPEQILPYVAAVGASRAMLFADCVGHVYEDSVVLIAYPPESENTFCAAALPSAQAAGGGIPHGGAFDSCAAPAGLPNTAHSDLADATHTDLPNAAYGDLADVTHTGLPSAAHCGLPNAAHCGLPQTPASAIDPAVHSAILNHVDAAVSAVYQTQAYTHITVLAPVRPSAAPADATTTQDMFWSIPLPPLPPQQKLRNMLRRAHRDITLDVGRDWTSAHAALAQRYCQSRPLPAGTRHIFQHLGDYVRNSPDALVFSAYSRTDNTLLACALGEFASLTTAMYMFAFRLPAAPPGTSDALLEALCAAGQTRGHSCLNLGLGINAGISFFKHKWQARPFIPYVECAWHIKEKSLWKRMFG